jgi:hypothetical protein
MGHVRVYNAEQSLSFCHPTKQRLINGLADGVNERHGWHEDASPDYRPKFHVFTEKALPAMAQRSTAYHTDGGASVGFPSRRYGRSR